MGLVMSPMSTAAMNAVDHTKAGAASGVLSMSRMVGGTFGVAVMGALITTLGRSHLQDSLPAASGGQIDHLVDALAGGGAGIAGRGRTRPCSPRSSTRVNTALKIGSGFALVGALVAWLLIDAIPAGERTNAELPLGERIELDLVEAGDAGGAPQGEAALRRSTAAA